MNIFGSHQVESRTAGLAQNHYKSVQSWKKPKNLPAENSFQSQNNIIANLEKAAVGKVGRYDIEIRELNAYADPGRKINHNQAQKFEFADVVDVINPLHHLPVVNMIYREMTGDELHPMSQIIGGAVYGGPIGAVSGTANAISKMQTGKDLGEHVFSFSGLNTNKIANPAQIETDISFATNKAEARTASKAYEKMAEPQPSLDNLSAMPEISSVQIKAMPPRYNS